MNFNLLNFLDNSLQNMSNMKFDISRNKSSIIKVIGVGGGGGNAVNYMYKQGIIGVDFAICNTDNQALENSPVPIKVALGPSLTEGRGAGSKPEVGKEACIESIDDIRTFLNDGTKMLFITAGLGGGTGTGAAPIIAKASKEMGILTVAIVTTPFTFEGARRHKHALEGLESLKKNVDAYLVISNDKIRMMYGNLELSKAFSNADDVLNTAAKAIAEIITVAGYINVDFEDVNYVLRESGIALMGCGIAEGPDRARKAIEQALASPLLEDNDIIGAKNLLLNISSGTKEVSMDEVNEIMEYVQHQAGRGTDIIWGNCTDPNMGDQLSITIIAAGFDTSRKRDVKKEEKEIITPLDSDYNGVSNLNEYTVFDVDTDTAKTYDFEDDFQVANPHRPLVMANDPFTHPSSNAGGEVRQKNYQYNTEVEPLDNPETLANAEKVPAYIRRGFSLEDDKPAIPPKGKISVSYYADSEGTIKTTENGFLRKILD